jgi:hypothetical protein
MIIAEFKVNRFEGTERKDSQSLMRSAYYQLRMDALAGTRVSIGLKSLGNAAESPSGNEQARSRRRLQRAQIRKRCIANLLIGRCHV